MKFSKVFLGLFVPLLVVVIIVLTAFGRTLGSYFLEDDFGQVSYVSQIFAGDWQKLVSNFTGNYMQLPAMRVYRPFLLLSIMFDYAFWNTYALGYFITNIIFLIAAAMMLYLVLRQLTQSWGLYQSLIFALISAALFAASPLHCESVSLMVGRVDIICSFFYLLALWAFIRRGSGRGLRLLLLGLISFWVALLTKEMAVGLPVLLTAICYLFPESLKKSETMGMFVGRKEADFFQRCKLALTVSCPLWLSLLLYFALRRLVLGTFIGGYGGSVGASQWNHIFEKWTDPDTITRIIFPLNRAVFGDQSIYHWLLTSIYIAIVVLLILRICLLGIPRNWLALLLIWGGTVLAPIYQLWGLGLNLEGSRFVFFLTIPLGILLPALICAPGNIKEKHNDLFGSHQPSKIGLYILVLGTVTLLLLVVLEVKVAAKNNIPWVHAGKQTRALLKEGQKLASSIGREQKVIVLGIPKNLDGAHVIYNGRTFEFLMMPPFSAENFANRFITFDPIVFGDADLINRQRFEQELLRPDLAGCYVWRKNTRTFEQMQNLKGIDREAAVAPLVVPLPSEKEIIFPFSRQRGLWETKGNGIDISQCEKGTGVVIGPLDINPCAYDFLEMQAIINPPATARRLEVFWHGDKSNDEQWAERRGQATSECPAAQSSPRQQIFLFPLSRYWRWFTEGRITQVNMELPSAKTVIIKNIRFISGGAVVPKLVVADQTADNKGVYSVGGKGFTLQVDASRINGCTAVKVEFSKPDYFFENLSGEDRGATLTDMIINNCSGQSVINSRLFPVSAYYQVRSIGLDKNGICEGEWSDPVTIKFDADRL